MNSGMLKIRLTRSLIMRSIRRRAFSKISKEDPEKTCPGEKMQNIARKLRQKTPIGKLEELEEGHHPYQEKEPFQPFPNNVNPQTGEKGGPKGPEPTRYGDWERKGRPAEDGPAHIFTLLCSTMPFCECPARRCPNITQRVTTTAFKSVASGGKKTNNCA